MKRLLSGAGGFGDGVINVLSELGGVLLWSGKGLDNVGKKLEKWGKSVGGENGIKCFIE
ncbi:hypothetical protein [Staphylococcus epidermidis]|uniref:hypothetical protein n=1 Tax=Staphylococcus epidermidis TaxID=1282 RepID=UPI00164276FB|nr:hypothetical protein [Staphylococcus epidermidis]